MNKKKLIKSSGSALLELMLSVMMASFILLGLYRSYGLIQKSVNNLSNISELEGEKIITEYHFSNDIACMIMPPNIIDMFDCAHNLDDKKEDSHEQKNNKKLSDKEKKEMEQKFNHFIPYLPTLKNNDQGEIVFSFITSNALFSKGVPLKKARVSYILRRTSIPSQTPNIFALLRREEAFFDDKKESKENNKHYDHEYTILSYIEDPKIRMVLPIIKKEKNKEDADNVTVEKNEQPAKNNNKEKEKEKKNIFMDWLQKAQFTTKDKNEEYTIENINQYPCTPYLIILTGTLHSFDGFKTIPLYMAFPVSCAEFMSELFCNFEEKLKTLKKIKKRVPSITNKKDNQKAKPEAQSEENPDDKEEE